MTTDYLNTWRNALDSAPHVALRAAREMSEPLRSSCADAALASARALMARADREHGSRNVDHWCAISDEARASFESRPCMPTRLDLADYLATALAIGCHREPIVSDALESAIAIGYSASTERGAGTLTCLLMALDSQGFLDAARLMRRAGVVSLIGARGDDLILVDVGGGRLRIQLAREI